VNPINSRPNRKDIATTFTRKLVLDSVPSRIRGEHYIAATTVVVTSGSLVESDCFEAYSLSVFLGAIAKGNISPTLPHILFDGRKCRSPDTFMQLLDYLLSTPIAATQEYSGFDPLYFGDLMDVAYRMRAVLHVPPRLAIHTETPLVLNFRLLHLAEHEIQQYPGGRLYLCGVPELVLSPAELLAAGDKANDVAEITVFRYMFEYNLQSGEQPDLAWDHLKSHVQFVNSDFRPTLAEADSIKIKETGKGVTSFEVIDQRLIRSNLGCRLPLIRDGTGFWAREMAVGVST